MAFPADYSAYRTKQKLNKMSFLHNRVYITVYIMKIIVYIQHEIVYILHNIAYLLQKIVCILQKKRFMHNVCHNIPHNILYA